MAEDIIKLLEAGILANSRINIARLML